MNLPLRLRFIDSLILIGLFFLFSYYAFFREGKPEKKEGEKLPTLAEFRKDFHKADGSPYSDIELANLLMEKGIPFRVDVKENFSHEKNYQEIPIVFLSHAFSPTEQREIQKNFSEIYLSWEQSLPKGFQHNLKINQVFVNEEKKIQIYFNKEFEKIAQVESWLTDFTSSFASLGIYGLRGLEIFIEEKPLSLYLRDLDKKRDEKAREENYRGSSIR